MLHRLPCPPDMGEKAHSNSPLERLLLKRRAFLGTCVDDEADTRHIDTLQSHCAGTPVADLRRGAASVRSLGSFMIGRAAAVCYCADPGPAEWEAHTVRDNAINAVVVSCTSMALYVERICGLFMAVDVVDADPAWKRHPLAT